MDGHIHATDTRHRIAALLVIALHLIVASFATAQTYYCLPTCSQIDARFLSLAGSHFQSIAGDQIAITLADSSGADSLSFEIFDGETGGVWDIGTSPLVYSLYADSTGKGTGTRLVGRWYGSSMSDSAWYRIAVRHDTNARSESGAFFYSLKIRIAWGDTTDANGIEDDSEDYNASMTWSNFKIRSTSMIATTQFAFCAPLFSTREAAIVYPNYPLLTSPTYDGTWSLFVQVPKAMSTFEVWDGDMDFGSWDGLSVDTDDINTHSNNVPNWSGTNANNEGVATSTDFVRTALGVVTNVLGTGSPMDDNLSLAYRRSPSVYYDIVDPLGNSFRNNNPSGNREWERFVIGKNSGNSLDTAVNALPRGIWEVRITGMDMHNINAWRCADGILGVSSAAVTEPEPMLEANCAVSIRTFGRGPSSKSTAEISANGELFTWGDNCSGQLGDGSTTDRDVPVHVVKGDYPGTAYLGDACGGVSQVGITHKSMVAVLHDGTVYAWGENNSNLLGVSSTTGNITAPKRVIKGAYPGTTYLGDNWTNPIEVVAAGETHMAAVSAAGLVYTWGKNDKGQLGDNSTTDRTAPVRVLKGAYSGTTYLGDNPANPIIDVVAGDKVTYALAADGTMYAWGWNSSGQLGDNSTTDRNVPIKVRKGAYGGTTYIGDNAADKVIAITSMPEGAMALTETGVVYTWGRNAAGQLGDNTTTNRSTPVKVLKGAYAGTTYLGDSTTHKVTAIAAGGTHCMALTSRGHVYSWGSNGDGQLGDNTTTARRTPVRVLKGAYNGTTNLGDSAEAITALGGAIDHSLALSGATTRSYSWGLGSEGRLGEGATTTRRTPILVAQGDRPVANGSENPIDGIKPTTPPSADGNLSIDDISISSDAGTIHVTLSAKQDAEIDMQLFGADGDLVSRPLRHKSFNAGSQRIAISLPGDMPSGLYFVNVTSESGTVARQFLITR